MLAGDPLRGVASRVGVRQAEARQHLREIQRNALRVARPGPLEHEAAHRRYRRGLGRPEERRFVRDARRAADALAVDVDERASRVEQDRADVLHVSAVRAADSIASAMAWTSTASGPSTRMRRSGSVPE